MDQQLKEAIYQAVSREPLARALDIRLLELDSGRSVVEMRYQPDLMNNIYRRAHGGAVFALIDEAFETASQTGGDVAVALSVNVTYTASPEPGDLLRAEANEVNRTRKTALFDIRVANQHGALIATCQALAYRTGKNALEMLG